MTFLGKKTFFESHSYSVATSVLDVKNVIECKKKKPQQYNEFCHQLYKTKYMFKLQPTEAQYIL